MGSPGGNAIVGARDLIKYDVNIAAFHGHGEIA